MYLYGERIPYRIRRYTAPRKTRTVFSRVESADMKRPDPFERLVAVVRHFVKVCRASSVTGDAGFTDGRSAPWEANPQGQSEEKGGNGGDGE